MELNLENISDVSEKQLYYAKLGDLFVEDVWAHIDVVKFSKKLAEADDMLDSSQVKWLIDNVPGIRLFKVKLIIEENEIDQSLIF
jgi:hypothetical protein